MKIFIIKKLAICGVAFGLFGCNKQAEPILKMDAYFRPFMATSIVRLTEEAMPFAAGNQLHTQDQKLISNIISAIDGKCDQSPRGEDEMDLRVLIYFSSNTEKRTWKASNFDYFDSSVGKVCLISQDTKSSIEQILTSAGHT